MSTIDLSHTDLNFLHCYTCNSIISFKSSNQQQAVCRADHFICTKCEPKNGICPCSGKIYYFLLDESSPSNMAYFCKKILHYCPDCSYVDINASLVELHRVFTCKRSSQRIPASIPAEYSILKSTTDEFFIPPARHPSAILALQFTEHSIQLNIKNNWLTCATTPYPVGVTIVSNDASSIAFFYQSDRTCSFSFPLAMHLSLYGIRIKIHPVFAPIPKQISLYLDEGLRYSNCHSVITQWQFNLYAHLRSYQYNKAPNSSSSPLVLIPPFRQPLGAAESYSQLYAFYHISKLYLKDQYPGGGTIFFLPGCQETHRNEFFFFLVHLPSITLLVCPCCFRHLPFSDFATHLQIPEHTLYEESQQWNMATNKMHSKDDLTYCGQRIFGADFKLELLPLDYATSTELHGITVIITEEATSLDDNPPLYFAAQISFNGRKRLASICIQNTSSSNCSITCTYCKSPIDISYRAITDHFNLTADYINVFSQIQINTYSQSIIYNTQSSLTSTIRAILNDKTYKGNN